MRRKLINGLYFRSCMLGNGKFHYIYSLRSSFVRKAKFSKGYLSYFCDYLYKRKKKKNDINLSFLQLSRIILEEFLFSNIAHDPSYIINGSFSLKSKSILIVLLWNSSCSCQVAPCYLINWIALMHHEKKWKGGWFSEKNFNKDQVDFMQ